MSCDGRWRRKRAVFIELPAARSRSRSRSRSPSALRRRRPARGSEQLADRRVLQAPEGPCGWKRGAERGRQPPVGHSRSRYRSRCPSRCLPRCCDSPRRYWRLSSPKARSSSTACRSSSSCKKSARGSARSRKGPGARGSATHHQLHALQALALRVQDRLVVGFAAQDLGLRRLQVIRRLCVSLISLALLQLPGKQGGELLRAACGISRSRILCFFFCQKVFFSATNAPGHFFSSLLVAL